VNGPIITCVINCKSAEVLRRLEEFAASQIDLDHTIFKTLTYYQNGIETNVTKSYRLGEYFTSIEIEPSSELSFKLIFHVRHGVSSYWKDLIMTLLRSINNDVNGGIAVDFLPQLT
jgi:hypothetical protein